MLPAMLVRQVAARQEAVTLASMPTMVHAMNLPTARVALIKRTAPANATLVSMPTMVHAMNLPIARVELIKRTAPANATLVVGQTMVHAMKLPHLPIATHVQTRLIVASVVVFNLRTS